MVARPQEYQMLPVMIERHAIRIGDRFVVSFQRTLRLPDDGRVYPLPPGLGTFPLFAVAAYADRLGGGVPVEPGDALLPMYQREALWLGFDAAAWKPNAVAVAIGRINAVSGEPYTHGLHADSQDYLVCPDQPWLDGINAGAGVIRQFVAMPLGAGYTVEAALTKAEAHGGIQITVYEPRPGIFPESPPPTSAAGAGPLRVAYALTAPARAQRMGIGAGGAMRQKIYPDPYGIATWDQGNYGSITVHIVNSAQFRELTGIEPPPTPVSARTYTEHGLPWFDLYDEARGDLPPSERLRGVPTIAERDRERGTSPPEDESLEVPETLIIKLERPAPGPPGTPGPAEPSP